MIELIGLLGSICFALCGVPAAWEAYKNKHCHFAWGFLWLWAVGEILTLIYVLAVQEWILLLNYGVNLICIIILMYYNQRCK